MPDPVPRSERTRETYCPVGLPGCGPESLGPEGLGGKAVADSHWRPLPQHGCDGKESPAAGRQAGVMGEWLWAGAPLAHLEVNGREAGSSGGVAGSGFLAGGRSRLFLPSWGTGLLTNKISSFLVFSWHLLGVQIFCY